MAVKRAPSRKPRPEPGRRPKKNPLITAGVEKVDYKDINMLRRFRLTRLFCNPNSAWLIKSRVNTLMPQRLLNVPPSLRPPTVRTGSVWRKNIARSGKPLMPIAPQPAHNRSRRPPVQPK